MSHNQVIRAMLAKKKNQRERMKSLKKERKKRGKPRKEKQERKKKKEKKKKKSRKFSFQADRLWMGEAVQNDTLVSPWEMLEICMSAR